MVFVVVEEDDDVGDDGVITRSDTLALYTLERERERERE